MLDAPRAYALRVSYVGDAVTCSDLLFRVIGSLDPGRPVTSWVSALAFVILACDHGTTHAAALVDPERREAQGDDSSCRRADPSPLVVRPTGEERTRFRP